MVSEVMINGPAAVIVERAGRVTALDAPGLTRAAIQFTRPLGENPANDPIIDAQLAGSGVQPVLGAGGDHIRRFGGRAFTIEQLTATGLLPPAVVEPAAAVLGTEGNLAQSTAFRYSRGSVVEYASPDSAWKLKEAAEGGALGPGSGPGSQPRQLLSRSPTYVGAAPAPAWLPNRRAEGGAYEAELRWANGRQRVRGSG